MDMFAVIIENITQNNQTWEKTLFYSLLLVIIVYPQIWLTLFVLKFNV